ncbi:phage tail length tape measure family protein [Rhizobium sp. P44RR-XXIV]|uniref:phage tail length tape measure family protein n=1 Tax=Rhizobium sp. P44RR-XXIV TaxID=1921145 RepID=UPI000984BCCC|nr:phage tail length tape measure family protein [Rhizobium sp. P44RR-XXIV]TIX88628.1 hypothetical protein BSK43_018305 [Rhizobium sp. P44RR-XXIV]
MTDIATLGIKFTTVGADQVATGMNRVAVAADKVESAVGASARAIGTLSGKAAASAGAIGKATASMIEWRNSCSSTAGAVDKVAGSLTGMNAQSQSNQNSIAAVGIKAKELKDVLIEMGTRMASGDSPFMIGLQQGGKLGEMLSGAGGLTGIVSGLGKAFLSMLNPVSLVAQVLTTAAAVGIQYFMNTGRDIKSVNDILKQHADHISSLGPAYQQAIDKQKKYAEKSLALSNEEMADDKDAAQKRIMAESKKAYDNLSYEAYIDYMTRPMSFDGTMQAGAFDPARKAIEELGDSIKAQSPRFVEFNEKIAQLAQSGQLTRDASVRLRALIIDAVNAEQSLGGVSGKTDLVARSFSKMQDKINEVNPFGTSKLQSTQQALDDLRRNMQAGQTSADELKKAILELSQAHPDLSPLLSEIGRLGLAALTTKAKLQEMQNAVVLKSSRNPPPPPPKTLSNEEMLQANNWRVRFGYDDDLAANLKRQREQYGMPVVSSNFANGNNTSGGGASYRAEAAKSATFGDIVADANKRITSLKQEQAALGMTEQAAAKMRYETELLNKAQEKNIALTPEQKTELGGLAAEMASVEAATKSAREAMDFAKDLTKGFISDLKSGLKNGESFWKSFSTAAVNALNKIADKLLNDVLDSLFKVNGAASGGGIGGFFSNLFGFGGGGGFNIGSNATVPTSGFDPFSALSAGWAEGGYTGPGTTYEPAGIVHAGEVVWSQKDIARAGGVGVVEAMRLGRRGYADGGVVGEGGPQLLRAQPDASVPIRRLRADNQNDASGSASGVHVTVGVSVDEDAISRPM